MAATARASCIGSDATLQRPTHPKHGHTFHLDFKTSHRLMAACADHAAFRSSAISAQAACRTVNFARVCKMMDQLAEPDILSCCSSAAFARALIRKGPYDSQEAVLDTARSVWWTEVLGARPFVVRLRPC